jgi:RHS repeat-associated protein
MGNRIAKHVYLDNTFAELSLEKSTYYVRDASGNTMAVYEKTYDLVEEQTSYLLTERHIYGSSRLGMDTEHIEMLDAEPLTTNTDHRTLGLKQYELSNHLGNVLSVISDIKLPVLAEDGTTIISYTAVVVSATDYSAFGVALYGRTWSSDSYRYGFNGKEKDNEGMGGGNQTYDYGFRIYNPSLGKFLSVDPLFTSYPWYTPYQFAGNAPIWAIDMDGLEQAVVVRWYDQNNQCTGQTIFCVANPADRPLGQNNFLFINAPDTPANKTSVSRLWGDVSQPLQNMTGSNTTDQTAMTTFLAANTQGSTNPTLTDFQGNAFTLLDNTNAPIVNNAFIRGTLCNSDQILATSVRTEWTTTGRACSRGTSMEPEVIYFDDESSTYNPDLDTDNNKIVNEQELAQATAKLANNPDRTATVTGNASIEDRPGGTTNNNISNNRALTVFRLLIQRLLGAGGNASQVTNNGGAGSTNANQNPSENTDGQPSKIMIFQFKTVKYLLVILFMTILQFTYCQFYLKHLNDSSKNCLYNKIGDNQFCDFVVFNVDSNLYLYYFICDGKILSECKQIGDYSELITYNKLEKVVSFQSFIRNSKEGYCAFYNEFGHIDSCGMYVCLKYDTLVNDTTVQIDSFGLENLKITVRKGLSMKHGIWLYRDFKNESHFYINYYLGTPLKED